MKKDAKILIVGHNDVMERTLVSYLAENGYQNVRSSTEKNLNVLVQNRVNQFFKENYPQFVFLCSIRSGGIGANQKYPAEFLYQNIMGQSNVIHAAYKHGVEKLIYFSGSCAYPKENPQPITEDRLLIGALEETSEAYSISKIAGIKMCQAYKNQYGFNAIVAVPSTVYGPGSSMDQQTSHVIDALICKFHEAKEKNQSKVTVWGTGEPKREFLFADDFASGALFLMEKYDDTEIINMGCGYDVSIKELARMIADIVEFNGEIVFDSHKPDGTMQKLLDNSRILQMGWKPKVGLAEGIKKTYEWYTKTQADKDTKTQK